MSATATAHLFRLYGNDELGQDGYPPIWHLRLKHLVREETGCRCARCGHPYLRGENPMERVEIGGMVTYTSWSPCDDLCVHRGRVRFRESSLGEDGQWRERDLDQVGVSAAEARLDEGPLGPTARWEVQARFRILTVHHLDLNKANCRWWNLVPLCQVDHLVIQRRVVMERAFILEHSDWFKPYAAGFYALKYEDREIDRAEAIERMDELLAYERLA